MVAGRISLCTLVVGLAAVTSALAQEAGPDSRRDEFQAQEVARIEDNCTFTTVQELRKYRGAAASGGLQRIFLDSGKPLQVRKLALEILVDFAINHGDVIAAVPEARTALVAITRDTRLDLPRRLDAIEALNGFFSMDEASAPSARLLELASGEDKADPLTAKAIAVLGQTVRNWPENLDRNAAHANPAVREAAEKEIKRLRALDPKLSYKDVKLLDESKTQYLEAKLGELKNEQKQLNEIKKAGNKKEQLARVDELKKEIHLFEPKRLIDYGAEQMLAFYAASGKAEEAAAAVQGYSQLARQVEQLPPITWTEQQIEVTTRNGIPVKEEVVGESEHEMDIGFWGGLFFDYAAGYQKVAYRNAAARAKSLAEYFSRFDAESIQLIKARLAEKIAKDERMKAAQERRAKQATPAAPTGRTSGGPGGGVRRPPQPQGPR